MIRILVIALALTLAGCGSKDKSQPVPPPSPPPTSSAWTIGPIINGQSYSSGMPRTLDSNNSFAFPTCGGPPGPQGRGNSVNYVTRATGPLSGTITMRFTISGDAALRPTEGNTPRVRLYFQRRGDDWSGEGPMNAYRWFSRRVDGVVLTPGTHTLTVPLDYARWGGVQTATTQAEFEAAKRDASVVGFVFGGSAAAGHGVCVERGSARFTLQSFSVR